MSMRACALSKGVLMRVRAQISLAALAAMTMAVGCGGGSAPAPGGSAGANAPAASRSNVSLDKNSYPVFPNADAGADPAVPAEQGGKGFKGEGWRHRPISTSSGIRAQ